MPQSSQTPLTAERLAEIKDLLKYESSIAFYSHRAKESMLLLVAEAEGAAQLRQRVVDLEAGLPAMQEALLKALDRLAELEADSKLLASLHAHGVDSWEGYDDAREAAS